MTDFKFTPGPWVVHNGHVYAQAFMIPQTYMDKDGIEQTYLDGLVALVSAPFGKSHVDERNGNMALISAALEMLEALKAARTDLENLNCPTDYIDAALDKASGGSSAK